MKAIRFNTSLKTRNTFIYAGWVEIRISVGHEGVEVVFAIVLNFEIFFLQEVVEILKKVVIRGRDIRRVWWVVTSFIAQRVQVLSLKCV